MVFSAGLPKHRQQGKTPGTARKCLYSFRFVFGLRVLSSRFMRTLRKCNHITTLENGIKPHKTTVCRVSARVQAPSTTAPKPYFKGFLKLSGSLLLPFMITYQDKRTDHGDRPPGRVQKIGLNQEQTRQFLGDLRRFINQTYINLYRANKKGSTA